jgi:hypothetical protein
MADMSLAINQIDYADLQSRDPAVKYGCAKKLLALAGEDPARLYPRLDFFARLMEGDNRIIRWTAIDIIGRLARVDAAGRVDRLLPRLFGLLDCGNMITANHAIAALANIALARPEHRDSITGELLKVEHYTYDTVECRNIAMGQVILAIGPYFEQLPEKRAVVDFVRRQANNTRNATRKKAEQFLKKHGV